jgi:hypothetical protein
MELYGFNMRDDDPVYVECELCHEHYTIGKFDEGLCPDCSKLKMCRECDNYKICIILDMDWWRGKRQECWEKRGRK